MGKEKNFKIHMAYNKREKHACYKQNNPIFFCARALDKGHKFVLISFHFQNVMLS